MININTVVTQFTLYCYIYYMHNSVESYRNSKEKNYFASIAAYKSGCSLVQIGLLWSETLLNSMSGALAKVLGHLSAGGRFPRHPSVIYVALNLKQK